MIHNLTRLDHNKFMQLISACLVATILTILGMGTMQWYKDWQLTHHPARQKSSLYKPVQPHHTQKLADAHLFGQSPSMDVPISNLQFRLTGIAAVNDAKHPHSKAYISVSGQPSKIFQTGDQLPFGVKIYAIKQNAVILSKDGKFEKLPLPRQTLQFKPRNTGDRL